PTFLRRLRILIETNIVSRFWDLGIANNVQGLLLRHLLASPLCAPSMEKFGGGGDDDDFASSFTESFASTTPIRPSAYKRGREGRSGATAASEREMAEERDLFLLLLAHAIACDDLAIKIQLYGPSLVAATKHESPVDL
ncbi:unnamed protein product, partial [Musa acuminata subsp. burmannicoides]